MARDNNSLGQFKLDGIAPAPRGIPQIEVTFDIDTNGIVSVSAEDLGTEKTQHVTITGGSALDEGDIDRMVNDAETYAAEDAERKEAAEARNAADHAAYTVGAQLAEHGDKLTEDEKAPIQANLDSMKELLSTEATTSEALRTATDELLMSAQAIGEKIYAAAEAEAKAAAADGDDASSNDDVVEAEVVEDEEA